VYGRIVKVIHFLGLVGFVGGLAASTVLTGFADQAPPGVLAALRLAIAEVGETLVVPSLILVIVSGMLLVVARPTLVHARWVWAKAVLAVVMAVLVLAVVQPGVRRAAVIASEAALGTPALDALVQATAAERLGGAAVMLLALAALVLAVWRPRFGQPAGRRGDDEA
jgi:hypothetical protein